MHPEIASALVERGHDAPERRKRAARHRAWGFGCGLFLLAEALVGLLFVASVLYLRHHNTQRVETARKAMRDAGYPITLDEFQAWYDLRAKTPGPYVNDALEAMDNAYSISGGVAKVQPHADIFDKELSTDGALALRNAEIAALCRRYVADNASLLSQAARIFDSEPGHIRHIDPTQINGWGGLPANLDRVMHPLFVQTLVSMYDNDPADVANGMTKLLKVARYVRDEPSRFEQDDRRDAVGIFLKLLEFALADECVLPVDAMAEMDRLLTAQEVANSTFLSCFEALVLGVRECDPATRVALLDRKGSLGRRLDSFQRTLAAVRREEAYNDLALTEPSASANIEPESGRPEIQDALAIPLAFVYDLAAVSRLDEALFLEDCLVMLRYLDPSEHSKSGSTPLIVPIPWYCVHTRYYNGMGIIPRSYKRPSGPERWAAMVERVDEPLLRRVAVARTAVAVQRFRQAEGRLPAKLDELLPKFLENAPIGPDNDGPVKYEVGEDESWRVSSTPPNLSPGETEMRKFASAERSINPMGIDDGVFVSLEVNWEVEEQSATPSAEQ